MSVFGSLDTLSSGSGSGVTALSSADEAFGMSTDYMTWAQDPVDGDTLTVVAAGYYQLSASVRIVGEYTPVWFSLNASPTSVFTSIALANIIGIVVGTTPPPPLAVFVHLNTDDVVRLHTLASSTLPSSSWFSATLVTPDSLAGQPAPPESEVKALRGIVTRLTAQVAELSARPAPIEAKQQEKPEPAPQRDPDSPHSADDEEEYELYNISDLPHNVVGR